MTRDEAIAALTAPGAPFELTTARVNGWDDIPVYRRRAPSLREMASLGADHGDRPFLTCGDRTWTFAGFQEAANGVSRGLSSLGVGHGDRVAVLAANCPEWALTFWGAVDLGAVLVALNGWWQPDEITHAVELTQPRVLVVDGPRLARLEAALAAGSLPSVEQVVTIDGPPDGSGPGHVPFGEMVVEPSPEGPAQPIAEDDAAAVFFTSGTTGRAKGVTTTHRGMVANLQNVFLTGAALRLAADRSSGSVPVERRTLLTSPMFHVSGCHSGIVLGYVTGQHHVLPPPGRLTAETVMELIEQHSITFWPSVPTLVWRVCHHPDRSRYDLSSVTRVAFGGAPAPPALKAAVRATFSSVTDDLGTGWGLTETTSAVTSISGTDYEQRPRSVGRPFPIVDLRIVDDDGAAVHTDVTGNIQVRGCQVTPGYWNDPVATEAAIDRDGWFDTGDIGHLDADGFLHLTDRAKDMILRGGENISSVEVEEQLLEHPDVVDAAVVGVPHDELGEEVRAVVQVAAGRHPTPDELAAFLAQRLAGFKVPSAWAVREDPLPRNAAGKVLKQLLRGETDHRPAETWE